MDQNTSQDIQPATATAEPVSNTEQAQADNQPAKVYTQAELDAIAAETRRKTEARYAKKFEGIDVEKYQSLMAKEEEQKISQAKEKSEFEKLLKDNAEKFQNKINVLFFLFFLKAEDGIRDVAVTGVQTCALPISTKTTKISKKTTRKR